MCVCVFLCLSTCLFVCMHVCVHVRACVVCHCLSVCLCVGRWAGCVCYVSRLPSRVPPGFHQPITGLPMGFHHICTRLQPEFHHALPRVPPRLPPSSTQPSPPTIHDILDTHDMACCGTCLTYVHTYMPACIHHTVPYHKYHSRPGQARHNNINQTIPNQTKTKPNTKPCHTGRQASKQTSKQGNILINMNHMLSLHLTIPAQNMHGNM
jgi:hypothetical protein